MKKRSVASSRLGDLMPERLVPMRRLVLSVVATFGGRCLHAVSVAEPGVSYIVAGG